MLRIELLPARMGDCIWLEYGTEADKHHVLIDGGTSGTYDDICRRLEGLEDPEIELMVITHIDNDHIAGALKYLEQPYHPAPVREVWFNGYRHLPETSAESLGPVQGERLTTRLLREDFKDRWNTSFGGRAVAAAMGSALSTKKLPGGLRLTVLAPRMEELAALRPVWKSVVDAANLNPMEPNMETIALPPNVDVLGALQPPDVEALAAEASTADDKAANASSIVLLAEYENKRMLFTGDAPSYVLVAAINRLVGSDNVAEVDVFQAPHHGSKANVTVELIKRIRSARYLFSSNGPRSYGHPNKQAVARILLYGGSLSKHLYFNYRHAYNRMWGDEGLRAYRERYNYVAIYPNADGDGVVVDL